MTSPENQYGAPQAPGTHPPPAATRGSVGRVAALIGGIGALLAAGVGGLYLVDLANYETPRSHESYAPAGTVELVADGDVTVRNAAGSIEVEAIAHGGLTHPSYSAHESGGRLEVTHECPPFLWLLRCAGELDVTLPTDTEVVIRTSNGKIVTSGLAGTLEAGTSNGRVESSGNSGSQTLSSSNGRITVTDAGADVSARTSNGRIEVNGVAGLLDAKTSNGRVEVSGFGDDVRARTSNGSVTVTGDDEPVRLTIGTSNGRETVEGPTADTADRSVEIKTSNGDASYLAR